jgi:hypothetical protein
MAVDNPDVVDIVSDDPYGRVVLTISDRLDWDDPASHLYTLQAKLNRYLAFIESGELLESRPGAAGKRVAIRVVLQHSPTVEGVGFFEQAKTIVEAAGFDFAYRVFTMFEVPPDAPVITAERAQQVIDEEGLI